MRASLHGAKYIPVLRSSSASPNRVQRTRVIRHGHRHRAGWAVLVLLAAVLCGCNSFSGNWNNRIGMWNYEQGNYVAAREEFVRAVADEPRSPAFNYNLGCAAQRLGDRGTAVQAYWRAIQLDRTHQPSYHALARVLIEDGRPDEATQLISTWVEAQPRDPGAQIEMAWLERENGDLDAAEQSLFRSLAARPNNPVATAQLGLLYEQKGQSERAAVMYRRSLQADWFQPQIQARLALLDNRGGVSGTPTTLVLNSSVPATPDFVQRPATVPSRLAGSPINDDPAHLID
jgi:Tfp pilus assembly protein PilF